mmetsp:Transcript_7650/g.10857  ORF Transcript_7650/g.10857 Transcript_7650/m.10857 type:complete len:576 (+) Transcript_7650:302-2029(+)
MLYLIPQEQFINNLKKLCVIKCNTIRISQNKIKLLHFLVFCRNCNKVTEINCEHLYGIINSYGLKGIFHYKMKKCNKTQLKIMTRFLTYTKEKIIYLSILNTKNDYYKTNKYLLGFINSNLFTHIAPNHTSVFIGVIDFSYLVNTDEMPSYIKYAKSSKKFQIYIKILGVRSRNNNFQFKTSIQRFGIWKKMTSIRSKGLLFSKLSLFMINSINGFNYLKKLLLCLIFGSYYSRTSNTHCTLKVLIQSKNILLELIEAFILYFLSGSNIEKLRFHYMQESNSILLLKYLIEYLYETSIIIINPSNFSIFSETLSFPHLIEHELLFFHHTSYTFQLPVKTHIVFLFPIESPISEKYKETKTKYSIEFNLLYKITQKYVSNTILNPTKYYENKENLLIINNVGIKLLNYSHKSLIKNYLKYNSKNEEIWVSYKSLKFLISQVLKIRNKRYFFEFNSQMLLQTVLILSQNITRINMSKYIQTSAINQALHIYCFNESHKSFINLEYTYLIDIKKLKFIKNLIHIVRKILNKYKIVSLSRLINTMSKLGVSGYYSFYPIWIMLTKKQIIIQGNYLKKIG